MSHYVRARHYSYVTGNWSTVDPLWPDESAYGYVGGKATFWDDQFGFGPGVTYPGPGTLPRPSPGILPRPGIPPDLSVPPFRNFPGEPCNLGFGRQAIVFGGRLLGCGLLLLAPCQTGDDTPEHYHRPSYRDCMEWYKKYNEYKPKALPACKSRPVDCAKLVKELKEFNENMLQYRFLILRCDKWPPKAPPGEEPWKPKPGHAEQLCNEAKRARNCKKLCPGIKTSDYEWILRNCDSNGGRYVIY